MTDRFDVVGFDPRGIAFSKNVKCFPSPRKAAPVLNTINSAAFPYGAKQEKAFVKAYGKHAKACSTTGKPLSGRCRPPRSRGTWICSAGRWATRS